MLNFDFLDKSLGIFSPAHFVYDFSKSKSQDKNLNKYLENEKSF